LPLPDFDDELLLEEDLLLELLLLEDPPLLLEDPELLLTEPDEELDPLLTDPDDLELEAPLENPLDEDDLELLLETPLELDGLTLEEDLEEEFLLKDTPFVVLLLELRPALKAGLLREVLEDTAFLLLLLEVVATLEEERLEVLESLNL
jgi:hypothetical protein